MNLMGNLILCTGLLLLGCTSCATQEKSRELSVMQLNVWMEAKVVENGFSAVVDEIVRVDPDVVMFSEAHSREDAFCIPALLDSLRARGREYYGEGSALDVQLISKYAVVGQVPLWEEHNGAMRTTLEVDGKKVIVYTGHLDCTHHE